MDEEDKKVIKRLLKGKKKVLEWGAGGSTVEFPEEGMSWLSIEHNEDWYKAIINKTKATVVLIPVDKNSEKNPKAMKTYIEYPSRLKEKYDFILIDGRCRRRCLVEASKLLLPGGCVVLHDAQREWYWSAFELFDGRFLTHDLWVGYEKVSKDR